MFSPEQLDNNTTPIIDRVDSGYSDKDYQVDIRELDEESRTISGIHDIYGSLFDELGLGKVIASPRRNQQAVRILRDIVLARVACPDSKRASVQNLEQNFGVSLPLDKVYRMMDKLDDEAIERLNEMSYQQTRDLLGGKIDVIFFDATTLYFESFTEDEFRENGYSKDLKFNQPQVLLSLMVTKEGLPIGYQAFSGSTYEGHTLIPALNALKEKYNLDQVVYVADSGMFNANNLKELEQLEGGHINYIVGSRIKNVPKSLQADILNKAHYHALNKEISTAEFTYSVPGVQH